MSFFLDFSSLMLLFWAYCRFWVSFFSILIAFPSWSSFCLATPATTTFSFLGWSSPDSMLKFLNFYSKLGSPCFARFPVRALGASYSGFCESLTTSFKADWITFLSSFSNCEKSWNFALVFELNAVYSKIFFPPSVVYFELEAFPCSFWFIKLSFSSFLASTLFRLSDLLADFFYGSLTLPTRGYWLSTSFFT